MMCDLGRNSVLTTSGKMAVSILTGVFARRVGTDADPRKTGIDSSSLQIPMDTSCASTPNSDAGQQHSPHSTSDTPPTDPAWALERAQRLCVDANYRGVQRHNDCSVVAQAVGAADRSRAVHSRYVVSRLHYAPRRPRALRVPAPLAARAQWQVGAWHRDQQAARARHQGGTAWTPLVRAYSAQLPRRPSPSPARSLWRACSGPSLGWRPILTC